MKLQSKSLRTIILTLPAGKVKMGGELGAMLGQYNLNIMKFCNEFNEISKLYEDNLPIITHLFVLEGNTFHIELKGPSISFMLKIFQSGNAISLLGIYKTALIRHYLEPNIPLKSIIKNIISSIKSSNLNIQYE